MPSGVHPRLSVLGCLEPLLQKLNFENSIKTSVAYADDLLILIEGNSRRQLEQQSH